MLIGSPPSYFAKEGAIFYFQAGEFPGRVLGSVGLVCEGIGDDLLELKAPLEQDDSSLVSPAADRPVGRWRRSR